jgi:cytidylate kinase
VTPRVVTIDGAAGSGKSTLARALARELDLPYVNTGLMYRVLTLEALRREVPLDAAEALVELTDSLRFTVGGVGPGELLIDGAPPERALHDPEVEAHVSTVAQHVPVRERLRAIQRVLGEDGAVMEGRDIGTVVFPDAPLKLFLWAEPEARAERRAAERPGHDTPERALHARDERDARTPGAALFDGPTDAVEIDTGELDPARTLARALELVAERAPTLLPRGRSR